MEISEFAQELLQDVLAEADADGEFREDIFFDKACAHLQEAGELDTADRVPYRSLLGEFGWMGTEVTPATPRARSVWSCSTSTPTRHRASHRQ